MKILHLITRLILGGAQENTVLTCEGLHERGHEVTLAYGPIYGPEGSLLARARQGGYELVELPHMLRAVRPLADWRCYRQCRALIRRVRPDVVHTHSSKAGIIGRAAARAERVPAVAHTIHGLAFHPYQSALKNYVYVTAERWAARHCHRIAGVADAMTRQALAARIGYPSQYETVYSGMEVETFLEARDERTDIRNRLGLRHDDIAIGTVARLAELKGHDDLLDALSPLLWSRGRLRLLWVGDGWWRKRLQQRIRSLGLSDRVILTGLLPPDRIPAMIQAMDVLVHPSYREGLPRAVVQAMLCAVPVVSYDGDGAGEVCRDGRTGRLVPTGNLSALAEAVSWMVDHPAEADGLARRGQALCAERFDAATMVDQLEDLYRRLLARTRMPRPA